MAPKLKQTRLLFVVGQLGNGGLEKQLFYLLRQLIQQPAPVTCVVWNFDRQDHYFKAFEDLLGEGLIGFKTTESNINKIQKLRRLIRGRGIGIAISYTAFINLPVFLATLGSACKGIGSLRTSAKFYLQKGGLKAYLNLLLPPRLLVNSKQAIRELNQSWWYRKWVQTAYLPNVLDVDLYFRPEDAPHEYISISVGNVRQAKRLDRMLEVFQLLKQWGEAINHIHVGGGPDLEKIKRQVRDIGLDREVRFLGPSSDVKELLIKSSFFLHFSEVEGSPNVVMEAQAAGLPVISTECGDVREFVQNEVNGFIVDPYKAAVFAHYYCIIQKNEDQRNSLSEHASARTQTYQSTNATQLFYNCLQKFNVN